MKVLSHERARRLMHSRDEDLSAAQQAALTNHLAGCNDCRVYADDLRVLQRVLVRAMHTRWDSRYPTATSSRAIQQRWKEKQMKRESGKFIAVIAGIAVVVILVLFGPTLLSSSLRYQYSGTPGGHFARHGDPGAPHRNPGTCHRNTSYIHADSCRDSGAEQLHCPRRANLEPGYQPGWEVPGDRQ